MGLGVAVPSMLWWLAAVAVPLLLARLAVRRPRVVRWGPSELLAEAARASHLTRGGLPWVSVVIRGLLLAAAAAAATQPFWFPPARFLATPSAPVGRTIVSGDADSLIVLLDEQAPSARVSSTIRAALESLAPLSGRLGSTPAATGRSLSPTIRSARCRDLVFPMDADRTLLVLDDPPPPDESEMRRLTSAVVDGASLLLCLGPQSVGDDDGRRRMSTWLAELAGITVDGCVTSADSTIEVIDALGDADSAARGSDGFAHLDGPVVKEAAVLGGGVGATILARTQPEGRPLAVEARSGRGTICVVAVPMSLPKTAADCWSDLAAWPAFLPFIDRLVSRLLAAAGTPTPAPANHPAAVPKPLAPALVAVAFVCLLVDWWMAARAAGGGAAAHGRRMPQLGRLAVLLLLSTMAVAWRRLPPAERQPVAGPRPIALLLDASPSMAAVEPAAAPRDDTAPTAGGRLAAVLSALTLPVAGTSPLDAIARDRPVDVSVVTTRRIQLGRYPREAVAARLRTLTAAAPEAHASRVADAVVELATAADATAGVDPARPAAIVIASDGAVTSGASWATAARVAAGRGVPLIAIPVGDAGSRRVADALPPGFRITRVAAPRLCRAGEPFTVDIAAEATADGGPLEVTIAADAAVLARGRLEALPIAAGMMQRYTGRLVVPSRALAEGSMSESLIVTVAPPGAASAETTRVITTLPLAITTEPVRVLLIDAVPRFEYRFLERLVSRDRGFEVERCLLGPGGSGRAAARPLPQSPAEWNRFDVVVLGDVPGGSDAAERATAWRNLREAAATDGIGIAWTPGVRWWTDPDAGLDWLPAVPGAVADANIPYRLDATPGGRTSGWLVPGVIWPTTDSPVATTVAPEVFAVLHPAALRPTARVIATATALDTGTPVTRAAAAAVFVDRLGAATILGHCCETWRWQRLDDQAYHAAWRRNLFALAEPHLLGRLFAATLAVRPVAAETDDVVRIEITPGRADTDLRRLQLEVVSPSGDEDERRLDVATRHDLPAIGIAGMATVALEGLAAGTHVIRLVPKTDAPSQPPPVPMLPSHRLVVNRPAVELPNGPAAASALEAAATASGGVTVTLDSIDSLAATIGRIVQETQPRATASMPGRGEGPSYWLRSRGAANLLMLSLVIAAGAAWWQPRGPWASREPSP